MHPAVVREAKRLGRASPKSGERRSLRKIAAELAKIGEALAATGLPSAKEAARAYFASVRTATQSPLPPYFQDPFDAAG